MLVLTRKLGERIVLLLGGLRVTVEVTELHASAGRNPKVRVGIEAPQEVVICREEIEAEWASGRRSASSASSSNGSAYPPAGGA